jgi:hypothetical protein
MLSLLCEFTAMQGQLVCFLMYATHSCTSTSNLGHRNSEAAVNSPQCAAHRQRRVRGPDYLCLGRVCQVCLVKNDDPAAVRLQGPAAAERLERRGGRHACVADLEDEVDEGRSAAAMWRPCHAPERSRTAAPRRRDTASAAAAAVIGDDDDGGGRDRGMRAGVGMARPARARQPAGLD